MTIDRGSRAPIALGAALMVLFTLLGCRSVDPTLTPTSSPSPSLSRSPGSLADAEAQLAALHVIPRPGYDDTYRRDAFGPRWADVDGNGCNQRDDVLLRTVDTTRPFAVKQSGSCPHDVIAGTWRDPYTGEVLVFADLHNPVQAQQIPIDHVVALAVAYRYGARFWTAERRLIFANDTDNLQPTAQQVNNSKGAKDAAQWRPKAPFQCDYATRYVLVKYRYGLPVDASEKSALTSMLDTC